MTERRAHSLTSVFVLSRYNGGAYVIGVYGSIEKALADGAQFTVTWRGEKGVTDDLKWITSVHPRRWMCGATGDVLEVVEHEVKS